MGIKVSKIIQINMSKITNTIFFLFLKLGEYLIFETDLKILQLITIQKILNKIL